MSKIVCFTGHRQIPETDYPILREQLYAVLEEQILQGATVFRAGGAIGFDTLAALTVLLLRRTYPNIRLELILPCPSQTQGWSENDVLLYEQIRAEADSYRYISQGYYKGVLQMRNRALIEGADTCIAYLTDSHGGGTAFTAALALKKGLELINLHDRMQY